MKKEIPHYVEPGFIHRISTKSLHEASEFAAKTEVRYYLIGVHIRARPKGEGSILESTCGHMCLVIYDRQSFTMPEKDSIVSLHIIKMLPKTGEVYIYEDGRLFFDNISDTRRTEGHQRIWFQDALIDGKFPDIDRVIPDGKSMEPGLHSAGFCANYIVKVMNYFKKVAGKRGAYIDCYQAKPEDGKGHSSAVFMCSGHEKMVIIMPARSDHEQYKKPYWIGASDDGK